MCVLVEGVWKEGGCMNYDDIVVFEVMVCEVDYVWWEGYCVDLECCFDQEVIVIWVICVEMFQIWN